METYTIPRDIKTIGVQVETFPMGVGEAFESLMNRLPQGRQRSYYGISYCDGDKVIYYAVAATMEEGEAEKLSYPITFTIEKGEYITDSITNWQQNTACIKDVLGELMKDERVQGIKPMICVEWYKNPQEMLCMIKMSTQKV